MRERAGARETGHHLVVLPERNRLYGIRAEVADPWLRPPPARRQDAHETRDIGDGIGDTGAVVVVVREALVGLISGEGGAHAELELVGERLVDVGLYALADVERLVED